MTRVSLRLLAVLGVAISIVLAAVSITLLTSKMRSIERRLAVNDTASEVMRGAFDLSLLAQEYRLTPGERSLAQWQARSRGLLGLLDRLAAAGQVEERDIEQMRLLVQQLERSSLLVGMGTLDDFSRDYVLGKVVARAHRLSATAAGVAQGSSVHLSTEIRDSMRERQAFLVVFISLIALLMVSMLLAVLRPTARLRAGVERIGRGALDTRVPLAGVAELHAVGVAVNQMAARLGELTVSRDALEDESRERRRAEERALQALHTLEAAQEQMVRTEKLSALGTLVGGVAHEINNPLMGLMTYVGYARDHAPPGSRSHDVLGRAVVELDRIAGIVRGMLLFARGDREGDGHESCRPADAIEATRLLVEPELRTAGIALVVQIEDELPAVRGSQDQLQQVLVNVVLNARDALAGCASPRITLRAATTADGRVILSIADNGTGLPPGAGQRLFDPFYTTKPAGKGTGLGLAVSARIVHAFGGSIHAADRAGGGAVFEITLQRAPGARDGDEARQSIG